MSVKLSEETLSVEKPRVSAKQRVDRIAISSAMSGEPMKLCPIDPWIGDSRDCPSKTHPKPAFFPILSQAAAVKQLIRFPGVLASLSCPERSILLEGTVVDCLVDTCACVHSLAKLKPLLAISSGDK
ncbi:hypothetical protein DY000_02053751 [Brassica cretica]|uniref:Uncharacterized protein n=1 Tax=Brassica cretica TaxID=69181 RepID=A0ABQ7AGM7_BRACR|nr:hypothetical protein DY000_02053751 [Brassica cretica]